MYIVINWWCTAQIQKNHLQKDNQSLICIQSSEFTDLKQGKIFFIFGMMRYNHLTGHLVDHFGQIIQFKVRALPISKLDETSENKYFKIRIESVYYLSRFMNKKPKKSEKNVLNKFEFINSSIRQCVFIGKTKGSCRKNPAFLFRPW